MAAFLVIGLFGLLAVGVPVGIALAGVGMAGTSMMVGLPAMMSILKTLPIDVAQSYELITIPMFILMAELVVVSGVAEKLFEAMAIWLGRVKGGLAVATALAGAGMGAISGSSTAAAAALSSTSVPAMAKAGYESRFSCGVVAVSGTLSMLIPPSLALILYGIITETSVGKLLIAGIVPGLVVMLAIIATVRLLLWRYPERAPDTETYPWSAKFAALTEVWPMLLLLFLVTGIIYAGVATPTEAAGLGAFGALVVTAIKGRLTRRTLVDALRGRRAPPA